MIKLPQINIGNLVRLNELKRLFEKERLTKLFSKETLGKLVDKEEIVSAFRSDPYLIVHVVLIAATVVGCVFASRSAYPKGITAAVLFLYFNALVVVYVCKNRALFDWDRCRTSMLATVLIAFAIVYLILLGSTGWGNLLSAAIQIGLFATPIMAIDRDTRDKFIKPSVSQMFSSLGGAFSGNTIEDLAFSVLGAIVGAIVVLVVMLCGGTFLACCYYVGSVIGIFTLGLKYGKKPNESEPLALSDGCIDADTGVAAIREAVVPMERVDDSVEARKEREDDVIIIE